MLTLFCFTLVLLGTSLASPSADQYILTVIHSALPSVIRNEKLDPTSLPDYTFEYKDKTVFGKVGGKAEYTEGTLSRLSRVLRHSECLGPTNNAGRTVINCTLLFDSLDTSYKGKVKYGVLPKVTIHAKGNIKYMYVDVEVAKPPNQRQQVTVRFRSMAAMTTEFTGLGPLNKHMKVLEENYRARVASEVVNVISNRFRYAFEMAAVQVPMPLR